MLCTEKRGNIPPSSLGVFCTKIVKISNRNGDKGSLQTQRSYLQHCLSRYLQLILFLFTYINRQVVITFQFLQCTQKRGLIESSGGNFAQCPFKIKMLRVKKAIICILEFKIFQSKFLLNHATFLFLKFCLMYFFFFLTAVNQTPKNVANMNSKYLLFINVDKFVGYVPLIL